MIKSFLQFTTSSSSSSSCGITPLNAIKTDSLPEFIRSKMKTVGGNKNIKLLTSVNLLYSQDVILSKLDVWEIPLVPRVHNGFTHIGMLQTQTMSKLVKRHPVQVNAAWFSCGVPLIVIKMSITGQT